MSPSNEDASVCTVIWIGTLNPRTCSIFFIFVHGNRLSQEPACRYFPLEGCLLHCCRNLDLFGYLQLVQLHLNLPQRMDVENFTSH